MKLGILTFHSQLNYGGVLQCWALQTALEKLGHEVVVLDRWLDRRNSALLGQPMLPFKLLNLFIDLFLQRGVIKHVIRQARTKKFIRNYLRLTTYHFCSWDEYPDAVGNSGESPVDCIVVGSDQVWRGGADGWGRPEPYLLVGAPDIPAIAYAASFGMTKLPDYLRTEAGAGDKHLARPIYEEGLRRFAAISCREREGCNICSALGLPATHVADPTLLVDERTWRERFNLDNVSGNIEEQTLVCYFIRESVDGLLQNLEEFADQHNCRVAVIVDNGRLPFPRNLESARQWIGGLRRRISLGRVEIMADIGPLEFVRIFSNAKWIVSDSFHALMFSIVFNRNVRIISPTSAERLGMFARIEEMASHMSGQVVSGSIAAALESFDLEVRPQIEPDWLAHFTCKSMEYLRDALSKVQKGQ